MRPDTIDELAEWVRSQPSEDLRQALDLSALDEIIELRAEDMVVKVGAGIHLDALQGALKSEGLTLPLSLAFPWHSGPFTALHEYLDRDYPHVLMAQHGSWRNWVLGATVVLGDGVVAKSGSMVVKSVAGFDIHKFLIGAQGQLAIWGSVNLRVMPIRAVQPPQIRGDFSAPIRFIQRFQPVDRDRVQATALDLAGCTAWHTDEPARLDGDTLIPVNGLAWTNLPHQDLLDRAKHLFDPQGRLDSTRQADARFD